jgi:ATP-dependent metalloprotease
LAVIRARRLIIRGLRSYTELARQKAPCIIFIDEIDAVGGKRDDSFNRASKQSLNQLLVEMDGFTPSDNVIVIAATNLENTLDPALIRPGRFDRKVVIALPDKNDRKGILDYYLTKKKSSSDVDTEVLARSTPGFSGADLETMVNWAAIEAAKRKAQTISMRLLEESLLSVAMGRERKSLILNDETKQLCAFHEAGHALVALHTDGAHLIRKATLVPRGGALGMVNFLPNDSPLVTQKELLARMDTAMGGRVAEELIYGTNNITQGASSDFSQATSIAKNMVMGLGMSKAVGPFKLDEKRISDHMQHVVELEVQKILNESYARAQRVLSTHKDELHTLANALLKYETLSLEEIQRVLKGEELHYKAAEKAQELEAQRKIEEERIASARKRAEVKTELLRKAGQGEGVSPEKLPEGVKPAIMDGSSTQAAKSK